MSRHYSFPPLRSLCRFLSLFTLLGALAACTPLSTKVSSPAPPHALPQTWQAPTPGIAPDLPHQGHLADLSQWWRQWGDATLLALQEAAQTANPTLDAAKARLDQAKAHAELARAILGPSLGATLSANRGRQTALAGAPLATSAQASLGASWETDILGQNRASADAASQRLRGAQAAWHEARVSVAADVATVYVSHLACMRTLALLQQDLQSKTASARIAKLQADAGLATQTSAALAQAGMAESSARLRQQKAGCDVEVKALVSLTALEEPALRRQLSAALSETLSGASSDRAMPPSLFVQTVPAVALSQRPDVFQAAAAVAAASAEVGGAEAERYPRLSLNGSIGKTALRMSGNWSDASTWSIGPFSLSLPILDNGRFAANLAAVKAQYDEAAANYRAKARQAVQEVEEALVNLDSARGRLGDLQSATKAYQALFDSTEQRQRHGLAPLADLEEARRTVLTAQAALTQQQLGTQLAWIALYRAVGGGWSAPVTSSVD